MPAVQLERLKKQIQNLIGFYTQPHEFHRQLINLLENHADLTFRAGQASKSSIQAVESFHVSIIVLQQIERALAKAVREDPRPALTLADKLWADDRLEPRLIASSLLGMLPADQVDQVLARITTWARPDSERVFLTSIFKQGSAAVRQHALQRWIEQITDWLGSPEYPRQRLGILALLQLIEDRSFENLPVVFNLISPILQRHTDAHKNELRDIMIALSRQSTTETTFFLRQILSLRNNPDLVKLVRQCLPYFPEESRARLRSLLLALPR